MKNIRNKLKSIFVSCRPKQWTKNLVVCAAPFLTFQPDLGLITKTLIALVCFTITSSSIYLLNDSLDINSDKLHPIKKYRPIAAGLISAKLAKTCSVLFLLISFIISLFISKILLLILFLYSTIQILYCFNLKNKPIIDLFCISSGFLLRAASGAEVAGIGLSPWFLLSVGFLSLFIAVEKRKAELIELLENNNRTRKILDIYSINLLSRFEGISSTSTLITYSLWSAGPALNGAPTSDMIITIPFVLFGILRYQYLTDSNIMKINKEIGITYTSQNPEDILLKDKGIKLTVISWLITSFILFSL